MTWTYSNCRTLNSPLGNNTVRERHLQCYAWMVSPTPLLTAPAPRQPFSYYRQSAGGFRFSMLAALAALISSPPQTGPVAPSSPLDLSYAWDHAYWAEDPGWTNPGNGGNVTSWHDAGAQNIPLAGSSPYPTYAASDPNLGNKPSLTSSSVNVYMNAVGSTAVAQPGTVIGVFYNSGTGTEGLFDCSTASRWFYRFSDGSGQQQLYAGAGPVSYGTALGVGAYFAAITFNGASSGSAINGGAFVPAGATVGTNTCGDLRVPGTVGYGMAGSIAFLGFKGNGGLTPAQVTQLQTWAHNHYGFF